MAFLHSASVKIHRLHAYTFTNAAARAAKVDFLPTDIGKRAYDIDTKTFHDIKDVSSGVATWETGGYTFTGTNSQVILGDGSYLNKTSLPISTATQSALDAKLDASAYIQHFKGVFISLAALQTAFPTSISGDYAQVDTGSGVNLITYAYDLGEGWVLANATGSGASNTDGLAEGSTNLYFTAVRVRATVLTGLSLATSAAISATNTVLEALGLLQAQISTLEGAKQGNITLTTAGSSGAATLIGDTLNIPVYTGGGGSSSNDIYNFFTF